LLASVLLFLIAAIRRAQGDRFRHHWLALGVLFGLLSLDEIAMLHEYPIDALRAGLHATGLLYYTWVIPGMLFVTAVAGLFVKFVLHLDGVTRRRFVTAGAVFVAGAIGVEMFSGLHASRFGEQNLGYALIITCEEMLEMLGVVLFIRALLGVLHHDIAGLQLHLCVPGTTVGQVADLPSTGFGARHPAVRRVSQKPDHSPK
jgi:hypothetical protein